ncbi:MAG TPA: redoxin domain-containing protein [Baekduia sp.]|uniref:redoxin domain-containing protein n=1 Tax=Baekduia sp. TaxID=2600305 RepID=UPI002C2973EC|nr:redoxin domain-containing protein [Baekduia sp.]HMJ37502.1 redoxin domain-containing protein [Baekduia sp.]
MTIIAAGTKVPDFVLHRADGSEFTEKDLQGTTTVLVFYPFAFSPVCTDQLQVYEEAVDELREQGATLYGVSTDPTYAQTAFQERLGVSIEQLSDFEPKGATARKLGAYFEPGGMTNRALVIVGPDGTVAWSHLAGSPGDLPGVNLIFDGLAAVAGRAA